MFEYKDDIETILIKLDSYIENHNKIIDSKKSIKTKLKEINQLDYEITSTIMPYVNQSSLMGKDDYLSKYNDIMNQFQDKVRSFNTSEKYYNFYTSIDVSKLSEEEKAFVYKIVKSFDNNGFTLSESDKILFNAYSNEVNLLQNDFNTNINKHYENYQYYITDDEVLDGLPVSIVNIMKQNAKDNGFDDLHQVSLSHDIFLSIMTYAKDRDLRKNVYLDKLKVASDEYNNKDNINKILKLQKEKAKLFNSTFIERSLVDKMANDKNEVINFLQNVFDKVIKQAKTEYIVVQDFAERRGIKMEPWDFTYYLNEYKNYKFDIDNEELIKCFPAKETLDKTFSFIENVYGIKFVDKEVPTWHSDVIYKEIMKNNKVVGAICFDLYTRQYKNNGAWANIIRPYSKKQFPVSLVTLNMEKENQYMSIDSIETMLHEMGHALHSLFTKVDFVELSGFNVEWDAVEIPSQMMEYYFTNNIHYFSNTDDTGLLDNYVASDNFGNATSLVRQIMFSIYDMSVYSSDDDYLEIWKSIKEKYRYDDYEVIDEDYFPNAFSHIFSGGYSAGYYSYLWSNIYSADVYDIIKENKNIDKYIKEMLSVGGSRPMKDSFESFANRELDPTTFLKYKGIKS